MKFSTFQGSETSSITVCFTLLMLAMNQDVQVWSFRRTITGFNVLAFLLKWQCHSFLGKSLRGVVHSIRRRRQTRRGRRHKKTRLLRAMYKRNFEEIPSSALRFAGSVRRDTAERFVKKAPSKNVIEPNLKFFRTLGNRSNSSLTNHVIYQKLTLLNY